MDLVLNLTNMYKGTHLKHPPQVERMIGRKVEISSKDDIRFEMMVRLLGMAVVYFLRLCRMR